MTRERANEILRMVIYANMNPVPEFKDSMDAFYVGRMMGQVQRQLEIELDKEVNKESEG